jgi:hypothetical protein
MRISRFVPFMVAMALGSLTVAAQTAPPSDPQYDAAPAGAGAARPVPTAGSNRMDWNWTPAAFAQLDAEASTRSSFSLDRNTLGIAGSLMAGSDDRARQAISKIDGASVHILRFGAGSAPDEAAVQELRRAYRVRGWKHLVTNTAVLPASANRPATPGAHRDNPLNNGTTDLWLALDGTNVRDAVVLVESPRSVTLVTLAGNISPVDLLHLRGHFGIPKFDGDQFKVEPSGPADR